MNHTVHWASLLVIVSVAFQVQAEESRMRLSELDLSKMSAGWGNPQVDTNCVGKPMKIAGQSFAFGVGTHAYSLLHVSLDGKAQRFMAKVGVDDETQGRGTLSFRHLPSLRRIRPD